MLLFDVLLPSHSCKHMRDWFNYTILDKPAWMLWRGIGNILASSQMHYDHARLACHSNNVLVDDIDSRSVQLDQKIACHLAQAHLLRFLHHCLIDTDRESNLDFHSSGEVTSLTLFNYLARDKLLTAHHYSKYHPHPPNLGAWQNSATWKILTQEHHHPICTVSYEFCWLPGA